VLRHRHDEGRDQLADAEQRELHGRRPGVVDDGAAVAHGLGRQAQTKEFSKIIPDWAAHAGFARAVLLPQVARGRSRSSASPWSRIPTGSHPQPQESSTDQHRWQQFSVLPDRWKNNAFGGAGMACMLYVDLNDRRGNEGRFVGVMDSISGTAAAKRGAHNGWSAPGTTDITTTPGGWDARTDATGTVVANKNSQPGTTWDMYGVKASESLTTSAGGIGSRLANRANMGFAAGQGVQGGSDAGDAARVLPRRGDPLGRPELGRPRAVRTTAARTTSRC
jgi:hypothetical protein